MAKKEFIRKIPFKERKPLQKRFEEKIMMEPNTGCWLWTAAYQARDYGGISIMGQTELAHRIAYELYIGPIPDNLNVLHKCDTPPCCNPQHLFIGTQRDNVLDRNRKHRNNEGKGQANHRSKLTNEEVIMIRMDHRSQSEIAKRYGVTQPCVGCIKRRKTWKHLP